MTKIITIANKKGGVGKTTTTFHLACTLAMKGLKTCMIDTDYNQANLSQCFFNDEELPKDHLGEVILERIEIEDAVYQVRENLWLVPINDSNGEEVETRWNSVRMREFLLKKKIDRIKKNFDVILIDTPPTNTLVQDNALMAANGFIIVVKPSYFSNRGLDKMLRSAEQSLEENPDLEFLGILFNEYNQRQKGNYKRKQLDIIRNSGNPVFDTILRVDVRLDQGAAEKKSIHDYPVGEGENGKADFLSIYDEIKEKIG
ncbi:ParA family protein [Xanthovirga aplysinae]|uniref:ParA family protein n=1 Tax=Xanthovirga aplysinae TaxID=2529853 RepID=UPI0012BC5A37|nr:AAA family ATPase [Xanthovirga aplysinae]MTI31348.1 hypothetical protein [Xanthovirga aplysinae]